jgi:hypothetical protein
MTPYDDLTWYKKEKTGMGKGRNAICLCAFRPELCTMDSPLGPFAGIQGQFKLFQLNRIFLLPS